MTTIIEEVDRVARLRAIAAEAWAQHMVKVLKAALRDAPGWRDDAQAIVDNIREGILPRPRR